MSKYPPGHTVGAVYDGNSGNPYLDAMPDMLSPEQFARVIASCPSVPHNLAQMSPEERRGLLPSISSIYVPMPYQYAMYDKMSEKYPAHTRPKSENKSEPDVIEAIERLRAISTEEDRT